MVDARTFSNAVWSGNLAAVESLIAAGADVNAADLPRMPPLGLAIEQMWLDIVRLLIRESADFNRKRDDGWTPLMHAIDIESDSAHQLGISPDEVNFELAKLLLEAGAVPTIEALQLARRYANQKADALLMRSGAR